MWRSIRPPDCPNSVFHWQKTLTRQVFVLEKKSLQWSALLTKTSLNLTPENSLPPCKWESGSVQFTDGDYLNL